MAVEQTEGADTFHIYNSVNNRYVMLVSGSMKFDVTGGIDTSNSEWKYELTLWKKDSAASDSLIPGYRKVTSGEGIENNGVYLVTYMHQEEGSEHAVLVYQIGRAHV